MSKNAFWLPLMIALINGCSIQTACVLEENEFYCVDRKEDAQLKVCMEGFWEEIPGRTCGCDTNTCIDSTDGVGIECKDKVSVPCLKNDKLVSCNSEDACGECLNGETMCTEDGHGIRVCQGGTWDDVLDCEGTCRNGECESSDPDKCVNGEGTCDDNYARYCVKERWTMTNCKARNLTCFEGKCGDPCKNADVKCASDHLSMSICHDHMWTEIKCPPDALCSDGYCSTSCKTGDQFCLNDQTAMVCENEAWIKKPCELGCSNKACVDKAECQNGESACSTDGKTAKKCVNGNWIDISCDDGLYCVNGECVSGIECTSGDKLCIDDERAKVCIKEEWNEIECEPGMYCIEGACIGECKPGSNRCSLDSKSVENCDKNGQWVHVSLCPYVCFNSQCAGECTEAEAHCSDNGTASIECNPEADKNWTIRTCGQGQCNEGHCPSECIDGKMVCEDDLNYQICKSGQWEKSNCSSKDYCDSITNECKKDCNPGDMKCRVGTTIVMDCVHGKYRPTRMCAKFCDTEVCPQLAP